ncbi:MAG TPA: hypothetical protein VGB78_11420, partial [Thermoplasmata archaeon]
MKLESWFENSAKRVFAFNPILADRFSLLGRKAGRTTDLFLKTWMGRAGLAIIGFFLMVVIIAEVAVPYSPTDVSGDTRADPSWEHPFGTDAIGRDVLTRTMHGTKASLIV